MIYSCTSFTGQKYNQLSIHVTWNRDKFMGCGKFRHWKTGYTNRIKCGENAVGNHVMIRQTVKNTRLVLCEVEVYANLSKAALYSSNI